MGIVGIVTEVAMETVGVATVAVAAVALTVVTGEGGASKAVKELTRTEQSANGAQQTLATRAGGAPSRTEVGGVDSSGVEIVGASVAATEAGLVTGTGELGLTAAQSVGLSRNAGDSSAVAGVGLIVVATGVGLIVVATGASAAALGTVAVAGGALTAMALRIVALSVGLVRAALTATARHVSVVAFTAMPLLMRMNAPPVAGAQPHRPAMPLRLRASHLLLAKEEALTAMLLAREGALTVMGRGRDFLATANLAKRRGPGATQPHRGPPPPWPAPRHPRRSVSGRALC